MVYHCIMLAFAQLLSKEIAGFIHDTGKEIQVLAMIYHYAAERNMTNNFILVE